MGNASSLRGLSVRTTCCKSGMSPFSAASSCRGLLRRQRLKRMCRTLFDISLNWGRSTLEPSRSVKTSMAFEFWRASCVVFSMEMFLINLSMVI